MDNIKSKKSATTTNVLIAAVIIIIMILIGIALGAAAMGMLGYGEHAPRFGKASGIGCFLEDSAFNDKDSIASADQAISLIQSETSKKNMTDNKAFLQKIIDQSKAKLINPAVLISFWGAEQSFKNTGQAFGCGNTGDGSQGATGEEAEINCALQMVQNAITPDNTSGSSADWSTPKGENIWTRLLYHYVAAARKTSYDTLGYVSDSKENRIRFLSQLVPEQVKCNSGFAGGSGSPIGPWDSSFMTDHAGLKSWLSRRDGNIFKRDMSGVTLHWTGQSHTESNPYGRDGVKSILDYWMGKETPSVTHLLIDSDGTVYQFIPFNVRQSGSGVAYIGEGSGENVRSKVGANDFTIGIEIAGVGNELVNNETQKAKVVEVVNYLISSGFAVAERGSNLTFTAKRGIFGHYQTGGGGVPGCSSSRKSDPGVAYMEEIWQSIGATGTGC